MGLDINGEPFPTVDRNLPWTPLLDKEGRLPIRDVQRLALKPDDVLVVSVDSHLSAEDAENVVSQVQHLLGGLDNKVLVLSKGIEVGVLER